MVEINILRGRITSAEAIKILEQYDNEINIMGLGEIYYPYIFRRYWLKLSASLGRLSKLNKYVDCSIDLVYGRPSLAQGTPSFEPICIEEQYLLQSDLTREALDQIGHDFTFTYYLNRSKILRTPTIQLENEEAFYKKFYIVYCMDGDENQYQILLDAMDGNLALLQ